MFVTKRKYERAKRESQLWEAGMDGLSALLDMDERRTEIIESSLRAAESALDYKEAVIEGLQDDIYRMHCHHMAVRDMLLEAP